MCVGDPVVLVYCISTNVLFLFIANRFWANEASEAAALVPCPSCLSCLVVFSFLHVSSIDC